MSSVRSLLITIFTSFLLLSCSYKHHNKEISYKVFVINLDRSKDRLNFISKQLKAHNVKFERYSAIDGYNITITDVESGENFTGNDLKKGTRKIVAGKKYFIDCGSDPEINFMHLTDKKYMHRGAGVLGCMCSHRGVLLEAIKQKLDIVVVFEDDVKIISDEFAFLLHSVINQLPKNSVGFLDAHGPSLKFLKRDLNMPDLFVPLSNVPILWGAYALVYDIEAAKEVLRSSNSEFLAIDKRIGYLITNKRINGFIVNKKTVAFIKDNKSDIVEMNYYR